MRFALVPAILLLSGCGYVGDPKPPALNIPEVVRDLAAVQRGSNLVLSFTLPVLTTEGLTIADYGEVELRVGLPPQGDFQPDSWAASAHRVVALATAANAGVLTMVAPVAEFAGKEVFAVVRNANPKGRWSVWSNVVAVPIITPLSKPDSLKVEATAEGVRLEWTTTAPDFRVFRKAEKEEQFTQLAAGTGNFFVDTKAEYGKSYEYQVQGTQKVGERETETDLSDVKPITPKDTFAPAVPSGLTLLLGVNTVEVAWERNTEKDFRGYNIYRAVPGGAFEKIGGPLETPSYSDKSVETGKTYRYAVSSVDQIGNESNRSAEAQIVVQ